MRSIIHDQVSQLFIEGPIQTTTVNSSFQEGNNEKAAYHADLSQGYEVQNDVDANANDADVPYHEANERYD